MSCLHRDGYTVKFGNGMCKIMKESVQIATGHMWKNLYVLDDIKCASNGLTSTLAMKYIYHYLVKGRNIEL